MPRGCTVPWEAKEQVHTYAQKALSTNTMIVYNNSYLSLQYLCASLYTDCIYHICAPLYTNSSSALLLCIFVYYLYLLLYYPVLCASHLQLLLMRGLLRASAITGGHWGRYCLEVSWSVCRDMSTVHVHILWYTTWGVLLVSDYTCIFVNDYMCIMYMYKAIIMCTVEPLY